MRILAVGLVCSMALLAGCSKHKTAQAPAAPAQIAAAPAAPTMPSLARLPQPKAGRWQMAMTVQAGPGIHMTGELCLDEKTSRTAGFSGARGPMKDCSERKYDVTGQGVSFNATCKIGGRTMTTHGLASGDFNSNYAVDIETRMDPPLPGAQAVTKTHLNAKWLGPCLPGQTAGSLTKKSFGMG